MTEKQPRQPAADRARRRAIRAHAARAGVPYSVAARQLAAAGQHGSAGSRLGAALGPAEILASEGRTIYPASSDTHRQWLIECRERRPFGPRVADARRAADLPAGRAQHLAERFPPTRGEERTGVGLLYHGERRQEALAVLYAVLIRDEPERVPAAGDLAWAAELGEETAVDLVCAELDRLARRLLDQDRSRLWPRIQAVVAAGASPGHPGAWPGLPFDGAQQILDAVLIVGDDGHAPGTRVRLLADPTRRATIVGAIWGPTGPPVGYEIHPDGGSERMLVEPPDLVVLHRAE